MALTHRLPLRGALMLGCAAVIALPALAHAQSAPDAAGQNTVAPIAPESTGGAVADKPVTGSEIVVTGTSLRKVAPAGAEEITLDPVAIAATNTLSTDQLLATIPQLSSFGALQTANAGGTQLTVNRTNLRNLPQGVGGGSPTLVLMDGHRIVGMGVNQSYPDPDIIPPALIQRVDVLTDGGSAIYGADAIGGVVNFITKDDFDGVAVSGRQGVGEDYYSNDVNLTAGKAWSGGDAYVSYNHSDHSAIYGYDRSYVRNLNYATGLPAYNYCSPGNVTANGVNYAANSGNPLQASNANLCDNSKSAAFFPDEHRDSVMAGFHQDLATGLTLEVKAYYSNRQDIQNGGPQIGSAQLNPATPGYIPAAGAPGANQTAYFNFAGIANGDGVVNTRLQSWGITPTITWKFGHDWQLKAYYNYGWSKTTVNNPQVNQTALNGDVGAGTINPYNIGASNPAALANVLDYTNYGIGKDQLNNGKATFDGPLFRLPGGEVRVAIGGEYIHEKYEGTVASDITYESIPGIQLNTASRNVESAFGELNLPLVAPSNHVPLIYSFTISAAERYDHYSDFGGNWAPNIGATLKPISWISLRARWNRSFQAPSLVQLAAATSPTSSVYPNIFTQFDPLLVDPSFANNGGAIVAVQGTKLPLQPERARDYNLGFDISPPFLKGLNAHFTYWNIDYTGQIGTPPLGYGVFWGVPAFQNLVSLAPTTAQLQSFLGGAGVSQAAITNTLAQVNALGGNAYYAADVRSLNLGVTRTHGFDIAFDYHHDVSFGSVFASFNSSYTGLAINAADGTNFGTNQAGINGADFNSATVIGATVHDNFRAQLTWNHQAGFTLSAPAGYGQTQVGAFNTFDLYTQYDLKRGTLPPISFSVGVTNLFNTSPPVYYGDSPGLGAGYAGSTTGRVVQLGASVKF
ncbi:MAG: TonB-dependent receptor [Sphingomonadales bacterium]|nr:TonB-dependent receptor [Sphingomonadales bacterium]